MLGKTSGIDSKMLKKDYSSKSIRKEKMALLNKSMTMGSASAASDGGIKKMVQKHKVKKAYKNQMKGEQSYKFSPVKRVVSNVKEKLENVGDKISQASLNMKANKGRRQSMKDASGKTSRNSSVGLCKPGGGKCQQ
jgi:hypothetical protein